MFLQHYERALVAMGSLQPPLPLSSIFGSSLAAGVASIGNYEDALFIFLALSTFSPYAGAFGTQLRVRGEDLEHLSSISLNVTPP